MSVPATVSAAPVPARWPRLRLDPVALLALPAFAYLAAAYGWPLLVLLGHSLSGPDGISLAPFAQFLSDPFSWRVIGNTLRSALLVTLVCLLAGYPAAIALARARGAVQALLLLSVILPLSVGVVVKAYAWQIVLRRDGVVSQALVGLGIWDAPQRLLFTEAGLVIGAANVFLPFMILPIYAVIRLIDPRLSEAAATLGASPVRRFLTVTLPLTLPGIVSGIAFVFSLAVSMYVVPSLVIGDRYQTLATLTGRAFLFMRDERLGSATAVILLALAVAVVVGSTALARRLGGGGRS
ncbi:ABC transporter permease [Methylobacterium oryzihabitans]|uniref:ABC transporter permease n=1 Tax=Methylobacterium oryzihabitans TaxID=2499852 RepID=A0A3S2VCI3_9HYPH|nr:ABC transporter permease [Methylobacterium oryzihabitans]RVU21238.1 ABC transporter permease [Methylobacterium oryzihabitans]